MPMPSTTAELIAAAAEALVARDMLRLEDLLHHARNWLQPEAEAAAQDLMLRAMIEAACLLEGEPSDLESELA